jgi:hypothetical protein
MTGRMDEKVVFHPDHARRPRQRPRHPLHYVIITVIIIITYDAPNSHRFAWGKDNLKLCDVSIIIY